MIKVLNVINCLEIGGAERLLSDSLKHYKKLDVEVEVLVFKKTNSFFEQKLNDDEIPLHFVSSYIHSPKLFFELKSIFQKYDIIHAHLFPTNYICAMVKFLFNRKLILLTTEHNTYNRRFSFKILNPIQKFVYSNFNSVIAISDGVEKALSNIVTVPIKVINNGIDLNKFEDLNNQNPIENIDGFKICQVSSFTPQKDQLTLIKAIELLPINYKLILVGAGPTKSLITNYVKQNGLDSRVFFMGLRDDVPQILKNVDVVVQSSNWEGFGLSIVEGMVSGKPSVGSDVDGLREVLVGCGLLFEKGNFIMLSNILQKLFTDNIFYENVSKKCYEKSKIYDLKYMVKGYVELYQNLLLNETN